MTLTKSIFFVVLATAVSASTAHATLCGRLQVVRGEIGPGVFGPVYQIDQINISNRTFTQRLDESFARDRNICLDGRFEGNAFVISRLMRAD